MQLAKMKMVGGCTMSTVTNQQFHQQELRSVINQLFNGFIHKANLCYITKEPRVFKNRMLVALLIST